jgi:putative (di)nucleoside polyphosphate hydrolase
VIDIDGYRPNVGIILSNDRGRLLWARRIGQDAWQFPQGGIHSEETPEEALFRELNEELGLYPEHVEIMGRTEGWLRYRLPKRLVRHHDKPVCIGQKQKWFLLRLIAEDSDVCLSGSPRPEFDHWRWVSYWYPIRKVVPFKRKVYARALRELAPLLLPESPEITTEQGVVDLVSRDR